MIDWRSVIFTAIWVSGMAVLLAGWSYSRWARRVSSRSVTSRQAPSQRIMWLGLLLLITGLLALRVLP